MSNVSFFHAYVLVAMYRWAEGYFQIKPGMYRVIVCLDSHTSYDAVCDDFGNLVRVSQ